MNSLWAFMASIALIRSSLYNYLPQCLRFYISSRFAEWTSRFTTQETMVFREYQSSKINQLFRAANLYLGESLPTIPIPRVTVEKTENLRNLTFSMEKNTEMIDVFENVPMKWRYVTECSQDQISKVEMRRYELSFHKRCKDMVTRSYLPHILEKANKIQERNRVVKLYTASNDFWTSRPVIIQHPMTFETLAMNGDLKKILMDDLDRFMNSKEYYQQIGKVWKRGYLLYGPPGTGKSSLIAAMANHLNFDIYNLNLSAVSSDLALQNLLLSMGNHSILVIEDIDCSVKLQNRESGLDQPVKYKQNKVTLSGLLNFFDGILSCCGEGKILVATTNYKDRIDPALLRAGRMDMHIHMTYCTFSAFEQLALKYLEISDHSLFHHIEKLLPKVKVSPAEVAGELMKTRDPKASLEGLIKHLEEKLLADGNSEVSPERPSSETRSSINSVNSPGANLDVPADKQKSTISNSVDDILEAIEDMEKELLSYKESITTLQNKFCRTVNKLAEVKANKRFTNYPSLAKVNLAFL
ncbi:hypothetical protein DITRI_Ditri18aG0115600 [Diplodiscus trichospermus]